MISESLVKRLRLPREIFQLIVQSGVAKSTFSGPVEQKTSLGWILTHSNSHFSSASSHQASLTSFEKSHSDDQLFSLLQTFWEIEFITTPRSMDLMSPEVSACEQHFQDTHSRDSSGRYAVYCLEWSVSAIPGSFSVAKQTFLRMEKKFRFNSKLRE